MPTRRHFLTQGAQALAAASLAPIPCFASWPPTRRLALNYLTFAGLVDTRFRAFAMTGGRGTDLVLIKAEEQPAAPGGECFSLLFSGPVKRPLEQATYTFDHATLGSFEMFIVPKPADRLGCYYEAVFNRLP
jgi:hypothetical protein